MTAPTTSSDLLAARYRSVRQRTLDLCAPLSAEDQVIQPMPEASPSKWHLAHTSWFFETFVLDGAPVDPEYAFLFNSYYEAAGRRVERARRGMLSRPSLADVHAYRAAIDRRVGAALLEGALGAEALARLELGLHHEEQHQELILTDIKYVLGTQPLGPAYRTDLVRAPRPSSAPAAGWRSFDGGVVEIGAPAEGFAFDNERPRHRVFVAPFRLATRPVTNAEVIAFIADGGYRDHRHWLSDGWHVVTTEGWTAPLYWQVGDGGYACYELVGMRAMDPAEPACHLSFYEADAIARWLGARLPTEAEWEHAAAGADPTAGNFADDDRLHPLPIAGAATSLFGDVWEWTATSYAAYPGFRPLAGALGEYNGKFMSGQQVLRGGSCFTPRGHVRASYRNFFAPSARWQMAGVRIAEDA